MSEEKEDEDFEDEDFPIKIVHKGKELEINIGSLSFTYDKKILYWSFMITMIILVFALFYAHDKILQECSRYYMNYIKQNCTYIVNKNIGFNFSV